MSLDCLKVEKIQDITVQIDYDDNNPGGPNDDDEVSCGQNEYSELQNKYNKYFKNINGIPEKLIASIMCKCCKKLKPTGKEKVTWLKFYKCMKLRLSQDKHPKTITKLNELIKWHEERA